MKHSRLSACIILALAHSAWAQQVVCVDPNGSDTAPYNTWATATPDLQKGIDEGVFQGRPVLVAEGIYTPQTAYPSGGGNEDKTFLIDPAAAFEMHGGYLGNNGGSQNLDEDEPDGSFSRTILRGSFQGVERHHVVTIIDAGDMFDTHPVTLDGFKIRRGVADGPASSGKDVGGGLTVINPGGIGNYGMVTVENCWFDRNWSSGQRGRHLLCPGHNRSHAAQGS